MSDATPAVFFILMLIAPCAIALMGDRRKAKDSETPDLLEKADAQEAKVESEARPETRVHANAAKVSSGSAPVFSAPPAVEAAPAPVAYPQSPRLYTQGPDPYAQAARLYGQPAKSAQHESSFVQPSLQQQGSRVQDLTAVQRLHKAQPAASPAQVAEKTEAEALVAQAAAAKAHAITLVAAARAAQAKANQAAELAKLAACEAEIAHRAADSERDMQAQLTAREQARTASGEHSLPASHPSLNFPRSGRGRRAA